MLTTMLLASSLAHAGEIDLTRGGAPGVFVDGEAKGKLTKKTPLAIPADDGKHEIWVSWDDQGYDTLCHGTIELEGSFAWDVAPIKQGCDVLANEVPAKTMSRGAFLDVITGNGDTTVYTAQIDGKYRSVPSLYNFTPGPHTILVETGNGETKFQVCVGTVTLAPAETRTILLTPTQCTGFDNEVHVIH